MNNVFIVQMFSKKCIPLTNDKNIESVRKGRNLFLYPYFCTVGLKTNISTTSLPGLLYCLCKQRDNLIQFIFKHTHIIK